jgi:hypothetical protein
VEINTVIQTLDQSMPGQRKAGMALMKSSGCKERALLWRESGHVQGDTVLVTKLDHSPSMRSR